MHWVTPGTYILDMLYTVPGHTDKENDNKKKLSLFFYIYRIMIKNPWGGDSTIKRHSKCILMPLKNNVKSYSNNMIMQEGNIYNRYEKR